MHVRMDRNFHLVMGALVSVSLITDQQQFEAWRAGQVSMVTLVLAMVWIGRFAWDGFRKREAAAEVIRNRLKVVEERLDELERDARARRRTF